MATGGEREVMGLMLTTNAQLVAAVLRGAEDPATQSVMAAIAATRTRWDELWATFDERVTKAASVEIFQSTLATAKAAYGEVVALGAPKSSVVGGYTVVDMPTACERGDGIGRVSFDADEMVAGLFLLPADAP